MGGFVNTYKHLSIQLRLNIQMAPCCVCLYDSFRGWVSAPSIRQPLCCGRRAVDVHEAYYQSFLINSSSGPSAADLKALKTDLMVFIAKMNCGPILIRLAWHDSGTFDQRIGEFGKAGGAIGTIIFDPEMSFGANNGLPKARKYLETFKAKYPSVSWADLIQMASAASIEQMGGPKIQMKYGRVSGTQSDCPAGNSRQGFSGNAGLPDAKPPFGRGSQTPAEHLRAVFSKKMGFNDEEIVALSGAHTVGRAFSTRSGTVQEAEGAGHGTKYTKEGGTGGGMPGGKSWTTSWLKFDNEYYKLLQGEPNDSLAAFPTDTCLMQDPGFKPFATQFAEDNAAFMASYAKAHKKLSELGSKFEPLQGITID